MTQTIEQLTARVRELEAENARLKAECDDIKQVQFPRKLEAVAVGWKKQLAASQAYAEQLREALGQIEYLESSNGCIMSAGDCSSTATEALAIPHDTSALDAYVAEKVKEIVESHAPEGRNVTNAQHVEMGHKFVEQIATLTRQRDLAVEALKSCGVNDVLEVVLRVLPYLGERRAEKAKELLNSVEERGYAS